MRTRVGVALLTVCLGLAGCSLFGKKQTAQNSNPKPFMGSEAPAQKETAAVAPAAPGGPLPGANGYLAGQVVDISSGRPVKAAIEVKDLEDDTVKAAAVDYESREDGYFTIAGLKPGRHYRLIARAKDGGEVASGTVFVTPPKTTLLIQISKQFTTPATPPVPDPPKDPTRRGTKGTESSQDRSPPASLDTPIKIAPGREPPPPTEGDPAPPAASGAGTSQGNGNISNVVDGGFLRAPPPSAPAAIPNPATPWPPPPAPQWEAVPDQAAPQPGPPPILPPPAAGPSVHLPQLPTHVPSCLLVGNRLENFALKDLDGETWEFRRHRQGRLVLLDFWYSTCPACIYAVSHLVDLQEKYRQYKLEVIGIACETGPVNPAVMRVRAVRSRYHINYLTLMSGGGPEYCPVVKQFRVERYPTLFLLDESGTIIWHSPADGMDDYAWKALEKLIYDRLFQSR